MIDFEIDRHATPTTVKVSPASREALAASDWVSALKPLAEADCEVVFLIDYLDADGLVASLAKLWINLNGSIKIKTESNHVRTILGLTLGKKADFV